MEIQSTLTDASGQVLPVHYRDIDNESELDGRKVDGVHAYCFYGDKLVIVYSEKKGYWTPPGGGVETGDSVSEAVTREVKEETNMKVLKQQVMGFQEISTPEKIITHARTVCIVEPYGVFVADPDNGEISKIECIDPKDFKKYFDWGEIGDYQMKRALEMKTSIN